VEVRNDPVAEVEEAKIGGPNPAAMIEEVKDEGLPN
jgi:hypothetical protein